MRYFNVFGPKQSPNNPYAAVIPIFCKKFIENNEPIIYGDGTTSRDFTFVENVVQANIKALFFDNLLKHEVYNVACGNQISLLEMINYLNKITDKNIKPKFELERKGDVKHSKASIEKIIEIGYNPEISFNDGLLLTYNWYQNYFLKNLI